MTKAPNLAPKASSEEWFSSWFDTPYYHILYKDRNDQEAQQFIDNLTRYLNIAEDGKVLDLACGKGRHSVYLNALGYTVKGVDLSNQSIQQANQLANESLVFEVHDMRDSFSEKYDVILNLFTSFGYFETEEDDLKVLESIKSGLTEYGLGVIDFMNVQKVISTMIPNEVKEIDGIIFTIKRFVDKGFIHKQIDFQDKGQQYSFTEKVKVLTFDDFDCLMSKAGMQIIDVFGDYKLGKFSKESDRLILVFK